MTDDNTYYLKAIQSAARQKSPVFSMEHIATSLTDEVARTGLPNQSRALLHVADYITEALHKQPTPDAEMNDRMLLTAFNAAGVASALNAELREPAKVVIAKAYGLMSDPMKAQARSAAPAVASIGKPRPSIAPDAPQVGFTQQLKKSKAPNTAPADPYDLPNSAEQKIADVFTRIKGRLQGPGVA